jgi:hypothetical protein
LGGTKMGSTFENQRNLLFTTPGEIYLSLNIPKIFCYGTRSLSKDTISFIKENNLASEFYDAFHWLMIDEKERFISFLFEFIA